MTFFHFINCIALSYIPHIIAYKASGLSEYSAHWKCLQAAAMYFFVQFLKMLLLATFFPETEDVSDRIDVVGELLRCSVDLCDLIGLYFIMSKLTVKGPIKFSSAAIGWASAEFLMTRFIPFWVGARGAEFDWMYIRMSFETNILLVQHISTAVLVWLYARRDLPESYRYLVLALLFLTVYRPTFMQLYLGIKAACPGNYRYLPYCSAGYQDQTVCSSIPCESSPVINTFCRVRCGLCQPK